MFRLNLKVAFRNLVKNKVYTLINVGGLAIGLTAFVLLLLYINHENSYDKWDPALEKVYQVRVLKNENSPDNKPYWMERNDSRIAVLLRSHVPQLKYVTKVSGQNKQGYSLKVNQQEAVMVKGVRNADSLFFQVFPYQFLQGDKTRALSGPNSIVLKKHTAELLFGKKEAIGKSLSVKRYKDDPGSVYTVTGIIADVNTPESLDFTAITHDGKMENDPENRLNITPCMIYAVAEGSLDTLSINKIISKRYQEHKDLLFSFMDYAKSDLKVIPFSDVHGNPPLEKSWADKIRPVVALSIFLLLISIINFVNLATVQSVQRAKEVGIKKVLGSYKKQLIGQFLMEAAIQSFTALLICTVLVELLLPAFGAHFHATLSFWRSSSLGSILIQLTGIFVLVTISAGLYPAWVLSGYNPVSVLKGNYEHGLRGVSLRNGLIIAQFIIAVTFMITIGVMQLQSRYLTHKNLGFDRSHLINISSYWNGTFAERVRKIPGVEYVATTTQMMGNNGNEFVKVKYKGREIEMNHVMTSTDALTALDVQLKSGRLFSKEYAQDSINTLILNESAAKLLGKDLIGKFVDIYISGGTYQFQIVGVIKDYHSEGFDRAILPTTYKANYLGSMMFFDTILVRFSTDHYQSIIKAIEAEWNRLYPDWPMAYTSGEEAFHEQMAASNRLMELTLLFSVISIVLSLLGLFALSAFVAKRRTREIAVRKVLGASDLQIISMLNRAFLLLVAIANLLSWPLAYVLTAKWLQGFAYRIEMPVAPFVAATLISLVIALITVSIQARRAAATNPIDALKYE